MGTPMDAGQYLAAQYLFAGILLVLTIVMAIAMAFLPQILSKVFRLYRPMGDKLQPYECGMTPVGSARVRFSIKFYLVAMLFILFDIEAIFLYPWVVVFRELKMFAFAEMLVFVVLILSGFFYIWKKGALDWAERAPSGRK